MGGFGHGVGADDGQAGLGEHLFADVFVGALHAHHQRHAQVDRLAGDDDASGDGVALHDAAEDIDQNGFDLGVFQHDLEGLGDLLRGCAAAHVQKVGGLCAEQFDGVHGGHGQTCAVDQAADVAVQADVSQIKLAGFDFGGVFFVQVAEGDDVGMAVQGVGVKVELGVQGFDVAVAFQNQGIDLDQAGVAVHIDAVYLLQNVNRLGGRGCGHADGVSELFGLRIG